MECRPVYNDFAFFVVGHFCKEISIVKIFLSPYSATASFYGFKKIDNHLETFLLRVRFL